MNINIAYTIDIQGVGASQFSNQLVVGLYALKKTKRDEDVLNVYILYANVPGDLILKCQKLQSGDFNVRFIKIKESDLSYMQKFTNNVPNSNVRTWNGIVFARLWLPLALKDIDRVIYLDVDTLVRKSLHELYTIDLKGKKLGMTMGHTVEYGYNSGVLVIDCKSFRDNMEIWNQLDDFMAKNASRFYLPDQTTINLFFKNDIYELPLKYNYPPKPISSNVKPKDNEVGEAVIWHFYFPGPKQHILDEYEQCNVIWNSMLQQIEKESYGN